MAQPKTHDVRKPYRSESILAEGHTISNNTWETHLNCNQLVLGPSGTGKTRNFLKPNLLQMNASYLVLDTKGLLYEEVGPILAANGYRVENLDFTDVCGTVGYDPLDHIRRDPVTGAPSQRDILSVSDAICPVENGHEPFWDHAAANYFASFVAYVLETMPPERHTMAEVVDLFEEVVSNKNEYENHFEGLEVTHPDSFALALYRRYSGGITADKMHASILGIIAEKIRCLGFREALDMYALEPKVDFAGMGHEKVALFVTVSDVDYSLMPLTNLFVTQAFQALVEEADKCPGGMMPWPVRLYLDDFSNLRIPDFERIISVTRSREIWCTLLCQTVAQLNGLYGMAGAQTIMGNCDTQLVLAFQDMATANYYESFAGKTAERLIATPLGKSWLFVRGRPGELVVKYDVDSHPAMLEHNSGASVCEPDINTSL